MITIRRNSHHMNGESVEVLEVWRSESQDHEATMILSIPLDPDESVEAELEPDLTDTPYMNMSDREKAELHDKLRDFGRYTRVEDLKEMAGPDVMTPDGRRQVAEKMLDDLVRYHNAAASSFSQAKQDQYGEMEAKIRTEILELMGVDS